jgi:hypothetical protein
MKHFTVVAIGSLFGLVGCQSTPDTPREIQTNKQEQKKAGAFELYQQSKADYEKWLVTLKESQGLQLYSNDLYADLLDAWSESVDVYEVISVDPARASDSYSLFSSTTYASEFAKQLSEVAEKYNALMEIKKQADTILSDAIEKMNYLNEIAASTYYPKEYKSLFEDYKELFNYIAEAEIDDAQTEQVVFINKASSLELKVILAKYIKPLEVELSAFNKAGFHKVAAISYAKTNAEINAAKNIVKTNMRDIKKIELAVSDARFELAHLTNIVNEVKHLSSIKSKKFEPVILEFEAKLLFISKALNSTDYRDKPMRVQADLIVSDISKLQKDKSKDELEESIALLKASSEELKLLNNKQANLLIESKVKNDDLIKQLDSRQFQIDSLQILLNSYKEQLETKKQNNQATPSPVVMKESKVQKATEPTVAEVQEPVISKVSEPVVIEEIKPETIKEVKSVTIEEVKPEAIKEVKSVTIEEEPVPKS